MSKTYNTTREEGIEEFKKSIEDLDQRYDGKFSERLGQKLMMVLKGNILLDLSQFAQDIHEATLKDAIENFPQRKVQKYLTHEGLGGEELAEWMLVNAYNQALSDLKQKLQTLLSNKE